MHEIGELILNCALIWIFLQTIWIVLVSIVYNFSIPWIVWGSIVILILLHIIRVPPPHASVVNEVLGVNPLLVGKENLLPDNQGNEEQYCMRVVAHRGGGYDYPENSLSAFQNTKDKGCTAVEIDLRLTKDNIPIIFHDDTIERLTGKTGTVGDMTWEQLKELDITYSHPLRNKFMEGEKIALLRDVLEECIKNDQRIIIDIKEKKLEIVQVILDAYKEYPKLFQRAIISSFNPIVVYLIKRKEPRIVSSLTWRPYYFSRESYSGNNGAGSLRFNNPFKCLATYTMDIVYEWALTSFVYYIVGISAILLHKDVINQYVVHRWYSRGIRLLAWTVNLPSEKQYFTKFLKITYLTDTLIAENIGIDFHKIC